MGFKLTFEYTEGIPGTYSKKSCHECRYCNQNLTKDRTCGFLSVHMLSSETKDIPFDTWVRGKCPKWCPIKKVSWWRKILFAIRKKLVYSRFKKKTGWM